MCIEPKVSDRDYFLSVIQNLDLVKYPYMIPINIFISFSTVPLINVSVSDGRYAHHPAEPYIQYLSCLCY